MEKLKFGAWSAVLGAIGMLCIFVPFTSTWGWLQNQYVLISGLICFVASLGFSITSFSHKEKGILKFVPFILLIPVLYFAINFTRIMGGV